MKKLNNPIFFKIILVSLLSYIVADLGQLKIKKALFPTAIGLKPKMRFNSSLINNTNQYYTILKRNIFSENNIVPNNLSQKTPLKEEGKTPTGDPVVSSLKIKLLGTIVNSLASYSVATVSLDQNNTAEAYSVDDTIKNLATITRIERGRITFKNLNTNRLEYILIPEKTQFQFFTKPANNTEIQKKAPDSYSISKDTVTKYLKPKNLKNLLRQAHVVPNIVSRNPTKIEGFRFAQIKKSSIFKTLGFRVNDILLEVEGAPAHKTPPWELFNKFKESSSIRLKIRRNGQDKEFTYNIN